MKKGLLKLTLSFIALLSFVACSSSDSGSNEYSINVWPSDLNLSYEGGSETVSVDARLGDKQFAWKVSSNSVSDFVKVSPNKGNGSTDVTISVDKNETDYTRSGYIEFETETMNFKDGSASCSLYITQEAYPRSNISVGINEPSEIYADRATLSGNVFSASGNVEVGFYYGTSSSAMNMNSSTKTVGNGKFEILVDGLNPGTTYYCQAFAKDGSRIFKSERPRSFTTLEYLLYVWPESMNFSHNGGEISGSVSAYIGDYKYKSSWSISQNKADFVKISPKSGTGYTEFTVTADKNETDKERAGYIEFKCGDKTYTMYISQEANPGGSGGPFTKDDSFGDDIKL